MSPERLLKHFEQISEAPDAVPRLRRFILDLAVRGKLVEQNPEDGTAAELLKQVAAERVRLATSGTIRKLEQLAQIGNHELPFELPHTWVAARMGFLAVKLGAGSTPLGGKSVYQNEGIPFLRSQNVHDNGLRLDDVALIPESINERMSGTHLQKNDILLNITGASIGRCALLPTDFRAGNVSQHVAIVRLVLPEIREFIHLSLVSPSYQKLIMEVQVGVSREGLSMQRLKLFPMVLPPLAEQQRIVAKVDELMTLCGKLEAAQARREKRRDRLVASTLHGLNNGNASPAPGTHPTFKDSARFYLNHLPRLTTRPEHIHQLRQTILNLAVHGKLVPQDPDDEPASNLLRRIAEEKARLIKESKLKKQETREALLDSDPPFEVPTGWEWARAGALFLNVTDGFHNTPKPTNYGYKYITAQHIRPGKIDFDRCLYVDEKNHKELFSKTRVKKGDILIVNIGAGCGNPAIVEVDFEFSFKNVAIINLPSGLNRKYILAFLLHYRTIVFEELIKGGAQPFLGLSMLRKLLIPIPPIAEQHRIVAKVDEMMAWCGGLEVRLATNASALHKLLEATFQEGLVS